MDYKQKYLKYKSKYTYLKNVLHGGNMEEQMKKGIIIIDGSNNRLQNIDNIMIFIRDKIYEFVNQYSEQKILLDNKLRNNQEFSLYLSSFINKVINNLISSNPTNPSFSIYNTTDGLKYLWRIINGNMFEEATNGKTWLTIDKYYVQFLFFTTTGYMNFTIYPDVKKINFDYDDQVLQKNPSIKPEIDPHANIYIKYTNITFSTPYVENYKKLFDEEEHKENMINVIKYMYNYYLTKQTPFISFLGKARFLAGSKCSYNNKSFIHYNESDNSTIYYESDQNKAAQNAYLFTEEIFSNLLFTNCNLGFISGGYSGKVSSQCGITRTGYEMAKKYEKPIVTIMCNAGRFDRNKHSDVIGYYGMHWSDDTKALSSLSDAAIMIAPFGAWSQIELFYLLYKDKPTAVYLDQKHIEYLTNILTNDNRGQNIKDFFNNETIYKEYISYFGLGSSDKFGMDILFETLIYDGNNIIPNEITQKNINIFNKMFNIPEGHIFTIWYPHYLNNTKDIGIPIFINYNNITKYILNRLSLNKDNIKTKTLDFQKILDIKKPTQIELTLNRTVENPFNTIVGTYELKDKIRSDLKDIILL
jgi:hypothetical protein